MNCYAIEYEARLGGRPYEGFDRPATAYVEASCEQEAVEKLRGEFPMFELECRGVRSADEARRREDGGPGVSES